MSRAPISKKLRFEVFKRDSFTCQYCGAQAPDVVLNVDHIKPVATGGTADLTNLITSCFNCNSGKGARELADTSVIAKQRAQLDDLNERRQQLEMMLEWRESLASVNADATAAVKKEMELFCDGKMGPNEAGLRAIQRWVRKYGLTEVIDAVQASFDQYLEWEDDKPTEGSWEKAFSYVPKIIAAKRRYADKPHMADLFYIRGILRNRLHYCNEQECLKLLERAHAAGATIESLREFAKIVRNWTSWRAEVVNFIEDHETPDAE